MASLYRALAALPLVLAASAAIAGDHPPLRPGLWEMHMMREGAGAAPMPDMSERLKRLPPEQRAQVEAMMKARGIDLSGPAGTVRMCLTEAQLDRGAWQGQHGRCNTDVTQRGTSRWKWHSVCASPRSESDGEAVFDSPEHYTVNSSSTLTVAGQPRQVQSRVEGRWLAADCGGVKPVTPGQ